LSLVASLQKAVAAGSKRWMRLAVKFGSVRSSDFSRREQVVAAHPSSSFLNQL